MEIAEYMEIDYIGLMEWHLKRTVDLFNELSHRLGNEVFEVILETERQDRILSDAQVAKECASNTIEDILPYFGGEQNVVKKTEQGYILRTKSCGLANAAKAAGNTK